MIYNKKFQKEINILIFRSQRMGVNGNKHSFTYKEKNSNKSYEREDDLEEISLAMYPSKIDKTSFYTILLLVN